MSEQCVPGASSDFSSAWERGLETLSPYLHQLSPPPPEMGVYELIGSMKFYGRLLSD